jgi:hypothetical protein
MVNTGKGASRDCKNRYWVRDVSAQAALFGLPCPVLVTAAVWERCLTVQDDFSTVGERLFTLLLAFDRAYADHDGGDAISFQMPVPDGSEHAKPVELTGKFHHSERTGGTVVLLKLAEEESL